MANVVFTDILIFRGNPALKRLNLTTDKRFVQARQALGGSDGGFLAFPHIRQTFLDMGQAFSHVTKLFRDIKKSFPHITEPFFG